MHFPLFGRKIQRNASQSHSSTAILQHNNIYRTMMWQITKVMLIAKAMSLECPQIFGALLDLVTLSKVPKGITTSYCLSQKWARQLSKFNS